MTLGILEQLIEPLTDGVVDIEAEPVAEKPPHTRVSRAKAAIATRIDRENIELFQSALDEVRGVVVVSGYKSIFDIPCGAEEHRRANLQSKGKRPRLSKSKDQSDIVFPKTKEGEKLPYGWMDRLTNVLKKMMYVSGETAEPSVETTSIIEDIVRQQVIELVSFLLENSTLLYLHLVS